MRNNTFMEDILRRSLADSIAAKEDFYRDHRQHFYQLVDWVVNCFKSGNKLMLCGNGGSAADAQHLAAEFVNRFLINRSPVITSYSIHYTKLYDQLVLIPYKNVLLFSC